jgi:hypothetical protein
MSTTTPTTNVVGTTTTKPQTDFSKLDAVNLSFRRPAKWYMYVVKKVLKDKNTVDIKARPSAAAQVVRVAEALKRLGYVSYVRYYTTSVVTDGALQRFIVVTVKKTPEFDKLYDAREEERTEKMKNLKPTETTTTTAK